MSLLSVILIIVIVGVLLYCLNVFVPMEQRVKMILNIVVILALVIWLLRISGALGSIERIRI